MTLLHYLRLTAQVILAPRNGWEDMATDHPGWRQVFYNGFLPLTALAALTGLVQLVYHPYMSLTTLAVKAAIQFVAIFVTYYIAEFVASLFLLRNIEGPMRPGVIRVYIMTVLTVLSLTLAVINIVPFSPVLMLLPLYVVVVMRMADHYMSVASDRVGHFMLMSLSSIFIPPMVIMFAFGYLTKQTL